MGRSVSIASGSVHVNYANFEVDNFYCSGCGETFNEHKEVASDIEDEDDKQVCPHCDGSDDDCHRQDGSDEFDFAVEDFTDRLLAAFPSLRKSDRWLDREDHVVAENNFAAFGYSEYCGLVSMWVTPVDDDYATSTGLRDQWIRRIEAKFDKLCAGSFGQALSCAGRFSNGEALFHAVNAPNKGELGLGFSSKEGWL